MSHVAPFHALFGAGFPPTAAAPLQEAGAKVPRKDDAHARLCTSIDIDIHTHAYTYMYIYICVYVCMCVCVCVCIQACTCRSIGIHASVEVAGGVVEVWSGRESWWIKRKTRTGRERAGGELV